MYRPTALYIKSRFHYICSTTTTTTINNKSRKCNITYPLTIQSHKYTERQKKLITSSGRRSLKSTLSKLIIFGHKSALILLNKNIWKTQDFLASKRRKMRLNHERSFFKNRRNCSPSELHGGGLFRTFNSYSFNFNGGSRKRRRGYCLLRTPSLRGKQFLWFFENWPLAISSHLSPHWLK